MTRNEKIIAALEEMDGAHLVWIHREYCDAVNAYDDVIYNMYDFDEIMNGQTPEWIANRIYFGDYNPNAEYFTFNGYGNVESIFKYQLTDYIDIEEIAAYIDDNDNALYDDEIQEILDEIEEDDEQ